MLFSSAVFCIANKSSAMVLCNCLYAINEDRRPVVIAGGNMPLVRIDLVEGKSQEYRQKVGEIVYQTLLDVLGVPEHDRFQVIAEHSRSGLSFDRDYLGVHRSDDCIFLQITLNSGRSVELKQRFYKAIADGLHEGVKLRREDVFISLVEVPKENWSFGNGEAQYVSPSR
jgi:phenylpyruvate tautomerase PptA (4-oxalocrotonate tautomerase family)